MKTKKCNKCHKAKLITEFHVHKRAPDGLRYTCKACRAIVGAKYNYKTRERRRRLSREWYCKNRERCLAKRKASAPQYAQRRSTLNKQRWAELKEKAYAHYGKRCACCGEAEPMFLTIDHINNDGAKYRRQGVGGKWLYRWLEKNNYPNEFQILCRNCNFGKYINKGICPHKGKKK